MGHSTNIFGIISIPVGPEKDLMWDENLEIIKSLPDVDNEYPPITNRMFSKEFQPGWDERHLHFAANYKNLEFKLDSWVNKFEQLISRLMWLSVDVMIMTEISGDFKIWYVNSNILSEWSPTTEWESDGLVKC